MKDLTLWITGMLLLLLLLPAAPVLYLVMLHASFKDDVWYHERYLIVLDETLEIYKGLIA